MAEDTGNSNEENPPVLQVETHAPTIKAETIKSTEVTSSHLTDLSQLRENIVPKEAKTPRYSAESFKNLGQGQLAKQEPDADDPFKEIDPLWPLKRS